MNFIFDFLSKVESINIRGTYFNDEDIPYKDFKVWRSTGALSSRSFKERFRIILGKFLECIPKIE